MNVTVYTDGSFHAPTGLGAWGLVALGTVGGQARRIERSGACPGYCTAPLAAELAAIFAALVTLPRAFPGVRHAQLYTDCRSAIEVLQEDRRASEAEAKLARKIRAIQLHVTLDWIPSHQDDSASEHAPYNNQADLAARRHLAHQLEAGGYDLPRRKDDIRALSPADLVDLHDEFRRALATRFGGNGRGLRDGRAWAWKVLGLEPERSARVHDLTRDQTERVLAVLRSST